MNVVGEGGDGKKGKVDCVFLLRPAGVSPEHARITL